MRELSPLAASDIWRAAVVRSLFFLFIWVLVAHREPADVAVGIISASVATWASLNLLPARALGPRLLGLLAIMARFPFQSVRAGWDTALRALRADMKLSPGMIPYRYSCADGPARQTFDTVMSLFPGTMPTGLDASGNQIVHCLDVSQPVVDQLGQEEAAFRQAFAGMHDDVQPPTRQG